MNSDTELKAVTHMEEPPGSIQNNSTECLVSTPTTPSTWTKLFSKIAVEPILCGYFLARTLCMGAVLTDLLLYRTCIIDLGYNETTCSILGTNTEEAQKLEVIVEPHTTLITMANSLLGAIPPAIMSLFLGPWSDANGRKPIILWGIAGCFIQYLLLIVVSLIPTLPPIYVLLTSIPVSFTGGFICLLSATICYISDVTEESDRALRIGLIEGFLFFGVIVGTWSSSYVYSAGGYLVVFSLSAVISAITFIYTLLAVPETIQPSPDAKGIRGVADWRLIRDLVQTVLKPRERGHRVIIVLTMLTLALMILTMDGETNVSFLFTRIQFGWTIKTFTTWASVTFAIGIIGTMIGIIWFSTHLKVADSTLGALAFMLKIVESVLFALLPRDKSMLMYVGSVVGCFGGVSGAVCRSILSKIVSKQDLGKVFSLTASLEAIAPIAASPLYTLVYNSTLNILPGAFYLLSAAIYFVNVVFLAIVMGIQRYYKPATYDTMTAVT